MHLGIRLSEFHNASWPCWIFLQIVLGCASNYLFWSRPLPIWNHPRHFEVPLGCASGYFKMSRMISNRLGLLPQVTRATSYNGMFFPDRRSPKKSSHDENTVHQFEFMERNEMFQTASLTQFRLGGGRFLFFYPLPLIRKKSHLYTMFQGVNKYCKYKLGYL